MTFMKLRKQEFCFKAVTLFVFLICFRLPTLQHISIVCLNQIKEMKKEGNKRADDLFKNVKVWVIQRPTVLLGIV